MKEKKNILVFLLFCCCLCFSGKGDNISSPGTYFVLLTCFSNCPRSKKKSTYLAFPPSTISVERPIHIIADRIVETRRGELNTESKEEGQTYDVGRVQGRN